MKRFFRLGVLALLITQASSTLQAAEGDEVMVVFNGPTAEVIIPEGIQGLVSASVLGSDVVITSSTVSEEYIYTVTGATDNGSLRIVGAYKLTLKLAGASIHSNTGAAIDVENGKRVAVVVEDGTHNELSDCAGGLQKAAMYFSGHPEFEGAGVLNVTGNTKHAISAKEYLQLKKSAGEINILGAVSDGIHCGKGKMLNANNFFQINGGTVNISNVGGDCIDSDDFGCMLIKGGTLNLTVGDGGKGLKCDSILTMTSGVLNIQVPGHDAEGIRTCYSADFQGGSICMNVSGNGSKGIKAKQDNETVMNGGYASFNGTSVDISASGTEYVDELTGETSKCMCISVDKDMTQTAGDITLTLTGNSAKAYSVKGELIRTGGSLTASYTDRYVVNPHDFQYDMSVYLEVSLDGTMLEDYGMYQLAAFNGSSCCGVANVQKHGNATYAYMRIYSNEAGADVSFRLLDIASGEELYSDKDITFQSDATLGTPSSPYIVSMHRQSSLHGDVNKDGVVDVSDAVDVINKYLSGAVNPADIRRYDINGDGTVDVSDAVMIINIYLQH